MIKKREFATIAFVAIAVFTSFFMLSYQRVSAQFSFDMPNELVDGSQATNRLLSNNATIGNTGYVVVGTGEYDSTQTGMTILSPVPNVRVRIEHGNQCSNMSADSYTGIDAPLPNSSTTTSFVVVDRSTRVLFGPAANQPAILVGSNDCSTLDLTTGVLDLELMPDGRYGGLVGAKMNVSGGGSQQNSFRVVVLDAAGNQLESADVGFNPEVVDKMSPVLSPVTGVPVVKSLSMSIAMTDLPRYAVTDFGLPFTLDCGATVNNVYVPLKFYDVDEGIWQGVTLGGYNVPTVSVVLESSPIGDNNWTAIQMWSLDFDGSDDATGDPGNGGTITLNNFGPFVNNRDYRIRVNNIYRANAMQFSVDTDYLRSGSRTSCAVPDTKPTVSIAQNCAAPYTATITVNDADYATNAGNPVINYSLNGVAQPAVRARTHTVNMPDPTAALTVSANSTGVNPSPPGGDGDAGSSASASQNFGPCGYTFNLTAQPQPPVPNDPELPTSATASALIGFSGGAGIVNGVNTTRDYFVNRGGTYDQAAGTITGGAIVPPALTPSSVAGAVNVNTKPNDPILGSTAVSGIPVLQAADYICARLTVSPATGMVNAAGNILPGASGSSVRVQCTAVVNRPYLKVFGSDVMAGSGFGSTCTLPATSPSVIGFAKQLTSGPNTGKWVGAGAQMAVLANGNVDSFASSFIHDPAAPSTLVFSNESAATPIFGGGFGTKFCDDDFWATKSTALTASAGAIPALHALSDGQHQYTDGSVISSAPQPITKRIAIYIDGNVTITTNIALDTSAVATAGSFPSFYLIVRGNIYVAPNVTRLDGTYVAMPKFPATALGTPADGGRIFTCTDNGSTPSQAALYGACVTNKLTINGSFSATRVNFLRGGGSLRAATAAEQPNSSNIAEIFNFIPEMLLTTPAPQVTTTGQYDSVISLPPGL